jgi:GT2 family glycosyltransferase
MTMSRNIALAEARGDVIAFLDDDSFAQPDWAAEILSSYQRHSELGGVGGRAVRDEAGLSAGEFHGPVKIGVLRRDGMIGGQWEVDCGGELDVEHLQGCNMTFRREVLAELGGLRDEYPGPEVREETDLCLRVRRLGYRLVYNPKATVLHIGAPKPEGQRFDLSYEYYSRHNHAYLLVRNFGVSAMFARYLASSLLMDLRNYGREIYRSRGVQSFHAVRGLIVVQAGKAIGFVRAAAARMRWGLHPARRDTVGQEIADALTQSGGDAVDATNAPAASCAEPVRST